jgi:hypothetical protein
VRDEVTQAGCVDGGARARREFLLALIFNDDVTQFGFVAGGPRTSFFYSSDEVELECVTTQVPVGLRYLMTSHTIRFVAGGPVFFCDSNDEVKLECVTRSNYLDAVLAGPEHGVSSCWVLIFSDKSHNSLLLLAGPKRF